MPCSDTSSPAVSTSGSTLIPHSAFIAHSDPNDALNVNTPTATSPSACVPSWSKLPVYQRPPVPVARFAASAGTAKIPVASVPQTPAIPWTATAPIGSSIRMRSTSRTPSTAITPATSPMTIGAHGAGRGRDVRRQRDVGEVADPVTGDDPERRAWVEAEPAEPEDQHAERDERHVVARNRVRPSVGVELADPRPEQQRPGQRGERSLVVDDRRAGEVLHPHGKQPAVRVPDPVRDDRVDDREDDAEREVDPELRPLRHRAPDNRERDRGEYDLEEVRGAGGNRSEPGKRLGADREQLIRRGSEPRSADEPVPAVPERDSEADEVVNERRYSEHQHVLRRDVPGVLHPRQARLEERETSLHEHDQNGRDDDPDRARGDDQLLGRHTRSTSSSLRPDRLWVTFPTGVVQTIPSPDSLPLRAASEIAATTPPAISSATTKVRTAFGKNRDSKVRPRYSCVIPRWRPCPIASTTVTPTWPVCSSTASITVSTRSRITTASTLITRPPRIAGCGRKCKGLSLGPGRRGRRLCAEGVTSRLPRRPRRALLLCCAHSPAW